MTLAGCHIFSQLDFNSGFFQIPNDETSIQFTSFVLPFGQFEHLRMPQGLSGPPRHFQKTMQKLFQELDFVKVFIDDVLIHSKSFFEKLILHLQLSSSSVVTDLKKLK